MTAAGRPGSWAESPSPHTLSCSPSWCSLDYYLVSTRCARHASQTCVPGWPKPATIPVALPHTLRAASRLLAFAQDTGRLVATGRLCQIVTAAVYSDALHIEEGVVGLKQRAHELALAGASAAYSVGASRRRTAIDLAGWRRAAIVCV